MTDTRSVGTFDSKKHEAVKAEIRARAEKVETVGRSYYERTGHMPDNVSCKGTIRKSQNVLSPEGILAYGIKKVIADCSDTTGSMGDNVERAFDAMSVFSDVMVGAFPDFHWDYAAGIMQDIDDSHGVCQFAQFESDNRRTDRMRELVPDRNGGDSPEDYRFLMRYLADRSRLDVNRYGGRGYAMFVLDQVDRDYALTAGDVKSHLGYDLQGSSCTTLDVWTALKRKFYPYILQVGSGGAGRRNEVTNWWERTVKDPVIVVDHLELLPWYKVGIVYMTETATPSLDGLAKILANGNTRVSQSDVRVIWDAVKGIWSAGMEAKIEYPEKGSKFDNRRHMWPEGHPRFAENTDDGDVDEAPAASPDKPKPSRPDFSKF